MKFLKRFLDLFHRGKLEAEMTEEMRVHVELQTDRNLAAGMSPESARHAALRQFGNVASIQEQCREQRRWVWLEQWSRDFRFSLRSLRRSAGFTVAVVFTLALCIGANTTVMSVLYSLILKPMPFRDSGQLVEVYTIFPKNEPLKRPTSIAQYLDYKANADLFEGFALWRAWSFTIGEDVDPERGVGARVTADYFSILGAPPLLGRFYTEEECVPGRDRVLVLTQTYWERKFDADPAVIGRVLRLGGEQFTIVGVAPRSLEAFNSDVNLLKPFEWTPPQAGPQARAALGPIMYARVRNGVAHTAALAQLVTLERRFLETDAPAGLRDHVERNGVQVGLGAVRTEQTRAVRTGLLLLQGGALAVLLLGCVNVASLMLARADARQAEFAIRQALGAGRGALTRQLFVEGLVLAGLGALFGLILTWSSLRPINVYTTAIVREVQPVTINGSLLSATLLITLGVALVVALLPIAQAWRINLLASMQGGTRSVSTGGAVRAAGGVLVATQMALALVLLIGACLLVRSFVRVLAVDPGFDAHRVVQGRTIFGGPWNTPQSIMSTHALIVARMGEIPGVERVAYTTMFPLAAITATQSFPIQGVTLGPADVPPTAAVLPVSPGYFEVMGIRVLEGRTFTEDDVRSPTRRVFVVDQNFARKHFPGRSAVGATFAFGPPGTPLERRPTIIGVVAAAKLGGLEDSSGTPFVFAPVGPTPGFSLLLRTDRPASEIIPQMREKLRSVDPAAPLYIFGSLEENFGWLMTNRRAILVLLGIFAAIALLLAVVGIYGMLAYDVMQRTREIGIRGALGATRGQIIALILRQGMAKTSLGLGLGLVAAFGLTRYLRTLLFEVTPTDPVSFAAVAGGLALIALCACWLPARRAAKIDPMVALRAE